jgi:hypothetical protein
MPVPRPDSATMAAHPGCQATWASSTADIEIVPGMNFNHSKFADPEMLAGGCLED